MKAAILKAYTREKDPEVQRAYAECAEHYGFPPGTAAARQRRGRCD